MAAPRTVVYNEHKGLVAKLNSGKLIGQTFRRTVVGIVAALCGCAFAEAAQPTGWTAGGKSVLIMPVGFTDCPAPTLGPAGGWAAEMTNVSLYFSRQSYGTYWISNSIVTPAIDMGVASTNYRPWSSWKATPFLPDAKAKARLVGYDPDDYDLTVFHVWMPNEVASLTGGDSFHGGAGVMLNYSNRNPKIRAALPHELGHNLGAFHTRACSSSSYLTGCEVTQNRNYDLWFAEYGSYFDLMGGSDFDTSGIGEFCSYTKNFLGWLPDGAVASLTTSGVYRVHAYDQGALSNGSVYALKGVIETCTATPAAVQATACVTRSAPAAAAW